MRLSGANLTCRRGGREIFSRLDFHVDGGEVLAVTGRNGAGKSSLLRLIAGLLSAREGVIMLEGGQSALTRSEQTHYLGHRDALKPSLTVLENLAFWHDFLGGEQTDLHASLAAAGLNHTASLPAAYLSAGQRRRLSLARLLAVKRPIWLLDEPTSTLDADGQTVLTALMTAHQAQGGLIVAATHSPFNIGSLNITARELRIGGPA